MATEAFRGAGFDAYNMSGGLLEWAADGLPLDPGDGYVAEA
jgi:rhodanese-related sulfurtransferase